MFGKRPYEDEEYPSTKKKKGGEEISSFLPPLDLLVLGEVVGRLIPQEELMRVVRLLWEDMSLAKEKIQKFEEEGREFPEYKKVKQEMIPAHLQFTVVSEAMRKEKSPPSADQLIKFFVTLKGENLIKVLNLSGNPLGDEVMFYLADFLASNNSLAEIDLSQTGITERGIYFLAKALAKNTSVVKLDIANNSITSHGWYFLSCALAVNPHLKELVLVNCRIDNCYPKAFYLSAAILVNSRNNGVLSSLNLYFTNFGDIGAMALALALQENSPLLNLEMGYCCSYVGIMKIFNALSHNTTLTKLVAYGTYEDLLGAPVGMLLSFGVLSELNLQASHINDEAMFVFASGLKSHITLTKLNLGDNCFTKLGARLLADALEVNTSLQTLILFGTESALVSTCLRLNSSLTVLNLGFANTPIGDLPAKEKSPEALVNLSDSEKIPFCREAFWMFIQMSCLSSIFLEDNNLEDEGAKALATVLSKNETLTACDIASNNIGPLGIAALSSVLALEKCRLVSFKLSDNFAGDDGAASLAESLGVNTSLTLLDLSDTEIGDLGAQSLAQSLIHNSSLRALSLVKNAIGKTGAEELLSLVSANTSLTNLKLNPEEISEVIVKEIGIFAQSNKELLRNREQTSLKVLCEEMLRMR